MLRIFFFLCLSSQGPTKHIFHHMSLHLSLIPTSTHFPNSLHHSLKQKKKISFVHWVLFLILFNISWVECFSQKHFAFWISPSSCFLHRLHCIVMPSEMWKPKSAYGLAVMILEYKSLYSAWKSYSCCYFYTIKKIVLLIHRNTSTEVPFSLYCPAPALASSLSKSVHIRTRTPEYLHPYMEIYKS